MMNWLFYLHLLQHMMLTVFIPRYVHATVEARHNEEYKNLGIVWRSRNWLKLRWKNHLIAAAPRCLHWRSLLLTLFHHSECWTPCIHTIPTVRNWRHTRKDWRAWPPRYGDTHTGMAFAVCTPTLAARNLRGCLPMLATSEFHDTSPSGALAPLGKNFMHVCENGLLAPVTSRMSGVLWKSLPHAPRASMLGH